MRLRLGAAIAISAVIVGVAFTPSLLGAKTETTALRGITLTAAPGAPGPPSISDSLAGKPILKVASGGLAIGEPLTGTVVITNTSNAPLTVSVNQQNLVTGPAGKPDLATWAQLTVQDNTANKTIYNGSVAGFYTQPQMLCGTQVTKQSTCPKWAASEAHTFLFTLVIPNPPPGSPVVINSYQGTSLTTDFVWTSTT
jgi:hypothetical protein